MLRRRGSVVLSSLQPQVGTALEATLTDPDGVIAGTTTWVWEKSTHKTTWETISGATTASYTPVDADYGEYLRATASYTDGHGSGKSAHAVSDNTVRNAPLTNTPPDFPVNEAGTRSIDENTSAGVNIGTPYCSHRHRWGHIDLFPGWTG